MMSTLSRYVDRRVAEQLVKNKDSLRLGEVIIDAGTQGRGGSEALSDQPVQHLLRGRFVEVLSEVLNAQAVAVGLQAYEVSVEILGGKFSPLESVSPARFFKKIWALVVKDNSFEVRAAKLLQVFLNDRRADGPADQDHVFEMESHQEMPNVPAVLCDGVSIPCLAGVAVSSKIQCDHPIFSTEGMDLFPPHARAETPGMNEDQGPTLPVRFIIEMNSFAYFNIS